MNKAVLIAGTPCSGKSKITNKIHENYNLQLLNEINVYPNGLFSMKCAIQNNKYNGIVLIEHADILHIFDDIYKYFDEIIILLLNVSDKILLENRNFRMSQNITGDYLKFDILQQKKYIEADFNNINNKYIKYIANINERKDYDIEYNNIIRLLKLNTPNV